MQKEANNISAQTIFLSKEFVQLHKGKESSDLSEIELITVTLYV